MWTRHEYLLTGLALIGLSPCLEFPKFRINSNFLRERVKIVEHAYTKFQVGN